MPLNSLASLMNIANAGAAGSRTQSAGNLLLTPPDFDAETKGFTTIVGQLAKLEMERRKMEAAAAAAAAKAKANAAPATIGGVEGGLIDGGTGDNPVWTGKLPTNGFHWKRGADGRWRGYVGRSEKEAQAEIEKLNAEYLERSTRAKVESNTRLKDAFERANRPGTSVASQTKALDEARELMAGMPQDEVKAITQMYLQPLQEENARKREAISKDSGLTAVWDVLEGAAKKVGSSMKLLTASDPKEKLSIAQEALKDERETVENNAYLLEQEMLKQEGAGVIDRARASTGSTFTNLATTAAELGGDVLSNQAIPAGIGAAAGALTTSGVGAPLGIALGAFAAGQSGRLNYLMRLAADPNLSDADKERILSESNGEWGSGAVSAAAWQAVPGLKYARGLMRSTLPASVNAARAVELQKALKWNDRNVVSRLGRSYARSAGELGTIVGGSTLADNAIYNSTVGRDVDLESTTEGLGDALGSAAALGAVFAPFGARRRAVGRINGITASKQGEGAAPLNPGFSASADAAAAAATPSVKGAAGASGTVDPVAIKLGAADPTKENGKGKKDKKSKGKKDKKSKAAEQIEMPDATQAAAIGARRTEYSSGVLDDASRDMARTLHEAASLLDKPGNSDPMARVQGPNQASMEQFKQSVDSAAAAFIKKVRDAGGDGLAELEEFVTSLEMWLKKSDAHNAAWNTTAVSQPASVMLRKSLKKNQDAKLAYLRDDLLPRLRNPAEADALMASAAPGVTPAIIPSPSAGSSGAANVLQQAGDALAGKKGAGKKSASSKGTAQPESKPYPDYSVTTAIDTPFRRMTFKELKDLGFTRADIHAGISDGTIRKVPSSEKLMFDVDIDPFSRQGATPRRVTRRSPDPYSGTQIYSLQGLIAEGWTGAEIRMALAPESGGVLIPRIGSQGTGYELNFDKYREWKLRGGGTSTRKPASQGRRPVAPAAEPSDAAKEIAAKAAEQSAAYSKGMQHAFGSVAQAREQRRAYSAGMRNLFEGPEQTKQPEPVADSSAGYTAPVVTVRPESVASMPAPVDIEGIYERAAGVVSPDGGIRFTRQSFNAIGMTDDMIAEAISNGDLHVVSRGNDTEPLIVGTPASLSRYLAWKSIPRDATGTVTAEGAEELLNRMVLASSDSVHSGHQEGDFDVRKVDLRNAGLSDGDIALFREAGYLDINARRSLSGSTVYTGNIYDLLGEERPKNEQVQVRDTEGETTGSAIQREDAGLVDPVETAEGSSDPVDNQGDSRMAPGGEETPRSAASGPAESVPQSDTGHQGTRDGGTPIQGVGQDEAVEIAPEQERAGGEREGADTGSGAEQSAGLRQESDQSAGSDTGEAVGSESAGRDDQAPSQTIEPEHSVQDDGTVTIAATPDNATRAATAEYLDGDPRNADFTAYDPIMHKDVDDFVDIVLGPLEDGMFTRLRDSAARQEAFDAVQTALAEARRTDDTFRTAMYEWAADVVEGAREDAAMRRIEEHALRNSETDDIGQPTSIGESKPSESKPSEPKPAEPKVEENKSPRKGKKIASGESKPKAKDRRRRLIVDREEPASGNIESGSKETASGGESSRPTGTTASERAVSNARTNIKGFIGRLFGDGSSISGSNVGSDALDWFADAPEVRERKKAADARAYGEYENLLASSSGAIEAQYKIMLDSTKSKDGSIGDETKVVYLASNKFVASLLGAVVRDKSSSIALLKYLMSKDARTLVAKLKAGGYKGILDTHGDAVDGLGRHYGDVETMLRGIMQDYMMLVYAVYRQWHARGNVGTPDLKLQRQISYVQSLFNKSASFGHEHGNAQTLLRNAKIIGRKSNVLELLAENLQLATESLSREKKGVAKLNEAVAELQRASFRDLPIEEGPGEKAVNAALDGPEWFATAAAFVRSMEPLNTAAGEKSTMKNNTHTFETATVKYRYDILKKAAKGTEDETAAETAKVQLADITRMVNSAVESKEIASELLKFVVESMKHDIDWSSTTDPTNTIVRLMSQEKFSAERSAAFGGMEVPRLFRDTTFVKMLVSTIKGDEAGTNEAVKQLQEKYSCN